MKEINSANGPIDRIYPMPSFRTKVAKAIRPGETLTENDFQILLTYLSRDISTMVYDDQVSYVRSSNLEHLVMIIVDSQVQDSR